MRPGDRSPALASEIPAALAYSERRPFSTMEKHDMTTTIETTHYIKPGFGAWDATNYPIGGKFWRNGEQPLPVQLEIEPQRFQGYGYMTTFRTADGRKLIADERAFHPAGPNGTPAEDADGFLLTINGTDFEFLRSDTGCGWFATREDGAVTAGYYPDSAALVTAIEDDSIKYE